MGIWADGGGRARAGRRLGPAVAALAGATVVVAALAGRRRQRRDEPISPEDAIAGPVNDQVEPPAAVAPLGRAAQRPAGGAAPNGRETVEALAPSGRTVANGRAPAGAREAVGPSAPDETPTWAALRVD